MDLNLLLLFFAVLLHIFVSAKVCLKQNSLVHARSLDLTQLHIREYLPYLSCIRTDNQLTFYKCKVECKRQETCAAFQYVSFCELCIIESEPVTEDLNLDFLYLKQDQTLGKALYSVSN